MVSFESGKRIKSDIFLAAIGRTGNSDDLGLDALGLETNSRQQLDVNDDFQTALQNYLDLEDLRKRLVREIRRFKPEALITMDPTVLWVNDTYVNHPDHRAAAGAAVSVPAFVPATASPSSSTVRK